jgi:hypothetical protein
VGDARYIYSRRALRKTQQHKESRAKDRPTCQSHHNPIYEPHCQTSGNPARNTFSWFLFYTSPCLPQLVIVCCFILSSLVTRTNVPRHSVSCACMHEGVVTFFQCTRRARRKNLATDWKRWWCWRAAIRNHLTNQNSQRTWHFVRVNSSIRR